MQATAQQQNPTISAAVDALSRAGILAHFMPLSERLALIDALRGEEAEGMAEVVARIVRTIETMPKTYETDGQGREAIAHLHYFYGGCDWYITERDVGDGLGDGSAIREQLQAFGFANLGDPQRSAELGYISIEELKDAGVELDLYWQPQPIGLIMDAVKGAAPDKPTNATKGGTKTARQHADERN